MSCLNGRALQDLGLGSSGFFLEIRAIRVWRLGFEA